MHEAFRKAAHKTSLMVGSAPAFIIALALVIMWAIVGPFFNFSNTWQLVINTATTILTFLVVFLIQNTQNRETKSMQLKLDELLRAVTAARTGMANLDGMSDRQLDDLQQEFNKLAADDVAENGEPSADGDSSSPLQSPSFPAPE